MTSRESEPVIDRAPPKAARPHLRTLILGLGASGRDLHLASLLRVRHQLRDRELFHEEPVRAVDPIVGQDRVLPGTADVVRSLDAVPDPDPDSTVVHVCMQPVSRVSTFRELAEAGYKRIICEKPLAVNRDDAEAIARIAAIHSLDIVVAGVWLSSALTARLRRLIADGELGALRRLRIVQEKPRFTRTLMNPGHPTAFEVELPHSIGVALLLAGRSATLRTARCEDMHIHSRVLTHMGAASIEIEHEGGVHSSIRSDLTAPVRRRLIELAFEHGAVRGHYPVSRADGYSQLTVHPEGDRETHFVLPDEPLTQFLFDSYRYFAGIGPRPVSDLGINMAIASMIDQAKDACGIAMSRPARRDQSAVTVDRGA